MKMVILFVKMRQITIFYHLCPYLSKAEISEDGVAPNGENDMKGPEQTGPLSSFHGPITLSPSDPNGWDMQTTVLYQMDGRLAKSELDISDIWNIDLKVPCFGNHCAQDWAEFVLENDGDNNADPKNYIQPIENEHKLFGCDLWLEVTSLSNTPIGCNAKADVMLVLDRSGSIEAGEQTALENAAKAFVSTLNPSLSGIHMGQSSFATVGSLDQVLTDSSVLMNNAIDGLVYNGFTNLFEGISLAHDELTGVNDRDDSTSPDIMVIITDGNPNEPGTDQNAEMVAATEADAARTSGIEVFVVGVGSDVDAAYLINNIADDPSHYFAVADFTELQAVLEAIANCESAPEITGTLTVNKSVINDNSGSSVKGDFNFFANGIELEEGVPIDLPAGSYTITETGPGGYVTVFNGPDCDINGEVAINVGGDLVCNIVNNDATPEIIMSDNFGVGVTDTDVPNWNESGTPTEARAAGSGNDSASPDGDRFAIIADNGWICRGVSTVNHNNLALNYYWRGDVDAEDGDSAFVEYSSSGTCGSAVWTGLNTHELDDGNNDVDEGWSTLQSIGVPDGITLIRFRNANQNASNENFRIDGVALIGVPN
jgi:uncharacterized protein YegL